MPQLRLVGLQVHPKHTFSGDALSVAVRYIEGVVASILDGLVLDKDELGARVTRVLAAALTSELAKHADSEAMKAVAKLESCDGTGPLGKRAGLSLDVQVLHAAISHLAPEHRITDRTVTVVAAVAEYMAAEILELGGNKTTDDRRTVVKAEDILAGINSDEELLATGRLTSQALAAHAYGSSFPRATAAPVVRGPLTVPTRSISGGDTGLARRLNGLTQAQLAKIADFM